MKIKPAHYVDGNEKACLMKNIFISFLLLMVFPVSSTCLAENGYVDSSNDFTLVGNGKKEYEIVVSKNAIEAVQEAAKEFRRLLFNSRVPSSHPITARKRIRNLPDIGLRHRPDIARLLLPETSSAPSPVSSTGSWCRHLEATPVARLLPCMNGMASVNQPQHSRPQLVWPPITCAPLG